MFVAAVERLRRVAERLELDATDGVTRSFARDRAQGLGPANGRSERLQILDEVSLLLRRQTESTNPVVVRHDVRERRSAAVVEVRRVLPESTQRKAPCSSRRQSPRNRIVASEAAIVCSLTQQTAPPFPDAP
jgi:hypothetical protein